jgi:hypothetical protein
MAYDAFRDEAVERRRGHRTPLCDPTFAMSFLPHPDSRILGISHCEQDDWKERWLARPFVRDYAYWNNTDRPDGLTHTLVGKIVRIVQMDGCMAHSRSRSRTGTVLRVEKRPLYGSGEQYTMALARFGTGEEWHPAGEFFQQNNGEIVRRI